MYLYQGWIVPLAQKVNFRDYCRTASKST